jgi:hypothetical protein
MPSRTGDSLRLDMSSLDTTASPPIHRDETVQISLLRAFAGGYLDAYAWIIHDVMANAQADRQLGLALGARDSWRVGPSHSAHSSDGRIHGGHRRCLMVSPPHSR